MTHNTASYKNKACYVGTSVVDFIKVVVTKKDSLPVNHIATSVASTNEKESSVAGSKGQPTKSGNGDSTSIVSNNRKDNRSRNSYSKNNSLNVTTDLKLNNCDEEVDDGNIAVSLEVLR